MALNKHRSEREVRRQGAWLQSVLEFLPGGVAVLDSNGTVRFLNRFARDLTKRQPQNGKDFPAAELFSFPGAERFWSRFMADPPNREETTVALPSDAKLENSPVLIEGEIAASYEGERFAGLIVTFRDATARERAERARRHAEKMQALGRLAGGVAHDFNNLLGIIYGYADLLDVDGAAQGASATAEIKKAVEMGSRVVGQLLAFSRKDTPKTSLVQVDAVIESSRGVLSRALGSEISLAVVVDSAIAPVRGDAGQIQQILLNLVMNARDAMPEGGDLTIALANSGNYVRLLVSDTGTGMTSEVAERLFEPFFSTKAPGKGTGLGLSIVHGIVTDLGGTIEVESQPGRGATFTILLPAERSGQAHS
jgi:signal transduction histidine kinase